MAEAAPWNTDVEVAVLSQVASGNRAEKNSAFTQLYEHLRRPLFALCVQLTGNAHDAEEALQEVFVAIHGALPQFRGDAKLSTWAYRIAIRAALRVRAKNRRHQGETFATEPAAPNAEADPFQRKQLLTALETLPTEQRIVISLFAIDGLGHQEIADILHVPIGTIWSRLHTARKSLAGELKRSSV